MTTRRLPPTSRRPFRILLSLALLARLILLFSPGYVNDVDSYKRWGLKVAEVGLAAAYDTRGVDYPPLLLYALWSTAKTYRLFAPEATADAVPADPWLTAAIKLPHLVFDLLLAGLLYRLVGREGYWGAARRGPGFGRTAVLLWLWNPAVLWVSAYWGQPDGVHSALALAALAALAGGACFASGALLSAAGLAKPLAAPLVPLLAAAAALRFRLRGYLWAGLGGLAAAVVAFLPFVVTGRLPMVLRRVLLDLEAMPFTSVNAHNLWWLLGPWQDANAPIGGVVSPKFVGLTLFLAVYAMLLARAAPWLAAAPGTAGDQGARLCLVAAAIACAFFFLTTHMHENHMFLAIPLLVATAGRSGRLAWLCAGASLAVLLNTALHDPELPLALPGPLAAASPFVDPHMQRPFTWLQWLGSHVDALLVGAVTAGAVVAAWNAGPTDGATESA